MKLRFRISFCLLLVFLIAKPQGTYSTLDFHNPSKSGTEICFVGLVDQNLKSIPFEDYLIYVNGTLLVSNMFTANISEVANISVHDLENNLVNNTEFTVTSGINHFTVHLRVITIKNHANFPVKVDYLDVPQSGHYQGLYHFQNETNGVSPAYIQIWDQDDLQGVHPFGQMEVKVFEDQAATGLSSVKTKEHEKIIQLYRDFSVTPPGASDTWRGLIGIDVGEFEEKFIIDTWAYIPTLFDYAPIDQFDDAFEFILIDKNTVLDIVPFFDTNTLGGFQFIDDRVTLYNDSNPFIDILYTNLPSGSWNGFNEWVHLKMVYFNNTIKYYMNEVLVFTGVTREMEGIEMAITMRNSGRETFPRKILIDSLDHSNDPSFSFIEGRSTLLDYSLHEGEYSTFQVEEFSQKAFYLQNETNFSYRVRHQLTNESLEQTDLSEVVDFNYEFLEVQIIYTSRQGLSLDFNKFDSFIRYNPPFGRTDPIFESSINLRVNETYRIITNDPDGNEVNSIDYLVTSGINQIIVPLDVININNFASEPINVTLERNFHYNADISFDLDAPNTRPQSAFIVEDDPLMTQVRILNRYKNHNKVLKVERRFDSPAYAYHDFGDPLTIGSIEFWFLARLLIEEDSFGDPDNIFYFGEANGTDENDFIQAFNLTIDLNDLHVSNETGNTSLPSDQWMHIRIDFNSSASLFDCYLDNVLLGTFHYFNTSGVDIDKMVLELKPDLSLVVEYSQEIYLDALDWSGSSGYYTNRNQEINDSSDLLNLDAFPNWAPGYYQNTAINNLEDWEQIINYVSLNQSSYIRDNGLRNGQVNDNVQRNNVWLLQGNETDNTILRYNISEINNISLEFILANNSENLNFTIEFRNSSDHTLAGLRVGDLVGGSPLNNAYRYNYFDGTSWILTPNDGQYYYNSSEWNFYSIGFDAGNLTYYSNKQSYVDDLGAELDYWAQEITGFDSNITQIVITLLANESVLLDSFSLSSEAGFLKYMPEFENITYNELSVLRSDYNFGIGASTQDFFAIEKGSYVYTIRDNANNILRNFTIILSNEDGIVYNSPFLRSSLIILRNQRGNVLDFNNFDVRKDNVRILSEIFEEDLGETINISVYDVFGDFITSVNYTIEDRDNFIEIDLTVFNLKILSDLILESFTNLSKSPTDFSITQFILPGEIVSFDLLAGTYQFSFIDDSLVDQNLDLVISADNLVILNTTFIELYVSIFDQEGLGISTELVKLFIDGNRKDVGFNFLSQGTHTFVIKDFFDAVLFIGDRDITGLREIDLSIEIYTMVINNNYSESIRIEIKRTAEDLEIKNIVYVDSQEGLPVRFLGNVKYSVKAFSTNGTLLQTKEVLLDTQYEQVNFGFYTKIGDLDLSGITPIDYLISLANFGLVTFVFVKLGNTTRRTTSRSFRRFFN